MGSSALQSGVGELLAVLQAAENRLVFRPPCRSGGSPFVVKYVASTTLPEPRPWKNSRLLDGDTPGAVARLKAEPGKDFVVLGSGELVRSLARHGLVDEYVLLIHPLILGAGRRLFAADKPSPRCAW
jgi:hypothetical protein